MGKREWVVHFYNEFTAESARGEFICAYEMLQWERRYTREVNTITSLLFQGIIDIQ